MGRSIRVHKDYIKKVKAALPRQRFPRQQDLAVELNLSLATVSNFLNGKPVDFLNFIEIYKKLGFDWQDIADTTVPIPDPEPPIPDPDPDFIYIERQPIEEIYYKTLSQPGALLRIKAPGWMGKTSLMANMLGKMKHQGYRTVLLDMLYAGATHFSSIADFLKWFCASVSQSLGMPNRLADYWDEQFSTSHLSAIRISVISVNF
jgi:transcriptional regulator with XRE-family HTH domain